MSPSRVVFFVQGKRVPAARVRGFLIARALQEQGVACDVRAPVPSVYGDTGLRRPFSRLWLGRPMAALVRMFQLRGLAADDVVFLQRWMIEFPTAALERMAARGRASIFDFDDAIFLDFGGRAKLRAIVGAVDHVIAGNAYLAEVAAAPDKTTVIPTVVDSERFRPFPTRDRRGKDAVIGWTGLRGNYRQLLSARPAIARALERTGARLRIISNAPPPRELASLRVDYLPWREATEVEDLSEIDVGIMPLPDTPFTRGKCAFKLIQYMALARPGVASPVGANREVVTDGVDGFLPQNDAAWEEALIALIGDPDLRQRMGTAARARVESAYSLRSVLPRYLEVLGKVSKGAIRSASAG